MVMAQKYFWSAASSAPAPLGRERSPTLARVSAQGARVQHRWRGFPDPLWRNPRAESSKRMGRKMPTTPRKLGTFFGTFFA